MIHQEFTDFGKFSAAAVAAGLTIETSMTDANRRVAKTIGDGPSEERGYYAVNLNHGELDVEDAKALKAAEQRHTERASSKQPPPQIGKTDTQAIHRVSGKPATEVKRQAQQSTGKGKQRS